MVKALPGEVHSEGKRKRLFFITKKEAQRCQKMHNLNQASYGNITDFDLSNYQRLIQLEKYADGIDLVKAVDHYRATYRVATGKKFKDAVKPYLKYKKEKNVSKEWLITVKGYLEKLTSGFGNSRIDKITRIQLEDFLGQLPYSVSYKDNLRRLLKNYFKYAVSVKWAKENPALELEPYVADSKKIEYITADNCIRLFKILKSSFPELIPFNVIRAFAGIRTSHVKRLSWNDINFEERGIRIKDQGKADIDFLQGHPENLWVWLAKYKQYKIFPNKADRKTGTILRDKRIFYPRNGFRHGFGTHHVALFKDISLTAYLMQHNSASTTKRYYKGITTEHIASNYFSIT